MERAPDPQLAYVPIPKERYTSPAFAQLDYLERGRAAERRGGPA
jgi:hypothetical protein